MKKRLDLIMVDRGLVRSRSQAQRLIKMDKVLVDGKSIIRSYMSISNHATIVIKDNQKYVSRAGFKLASVAKKFNLNFIDMIILDVGSSTGGFTDYALQNGAKKVIAVDVGTNQLHPLLKKNQKVSLYEKTDIRNFSTNIKIDIVLIDLSFISLREVLPVISKLINNDTKIVALLKPQFEVGEKQKNKGVVKNKTIRRAIIKDFETWLKPHFIIKAKADSEVEGSKGNLERFYLLGKYHE